MVCIDGYINPIIVIAVVALVSRLSCELSVYTDGKSPRAALWMLFLDSASDIGAVAGGVEVS
jgi:hypothetical protein